jgi:hypothetical protein
LSPRSSRLIAGVALLLAGLSAAGCGPSEEATFRKDKLRPAQQRIERDKSQIAAQLRVVRLGRARDAKIVGQQVEALAASVAAMEALKAPGSVKSQVAHFGVAHNHLVASLRRFAAALGHRSKSRLNSEAAKAQSAAGEVARARNALYDELAKHD